MAPSLSIHRRTWDLIPWVVNGTVDARQRAAVEAHASECEACRSELQFQRRLYAAIAAPPASATAASASSASATAGRDDVGHEWQRLRARLQTGAGPVADARLLAADELPLQPSPVHPAPNAKSGNPGASRSRWAVVWAAAAIFEAVALGALGMMVLSKAPNRAPSMQLPAYRTLSAVPATPAPATIRLVLEPTTTVAQLQVLLEQGRLEVVAGPSAAGVWSLAPDGVSGSVSTEAALRILRGDPRVRFAEPLDTAR